MADSAGCQAVSAAGSGRCCSGGYDPWSMV